MRLIIDGPPRTKKTSQRILRTAKGQPFIASSKVAAGWEASAVALLAEIDGTKT